jgi:hypothetical protein
MSDPVTNVDVEDVLSSIRRLVSDTKSEDRQASQEPEVAVEAPTDGVHDGVQPAEALILTSALRVKTQVEDSVPEFRHADLPNFRNILSEEPDSDGENTTVAPSSDHADWPSLADDDYYEDDEQPEASPVIDFIRHSRNVEPEDVLAAFSDAGDAEDANEAWEPEFVDGTSDQDEVGEQHDPVEEWVDEDVKATESPSDEVESSVEAVEQPEVETSDAVDLQSETDDQDVGEPECSDDDWRPMDDEDKDDVLEEESVFASAAAASVLDETSVQVEEGTDDIDLADFDESVIDEDALRDLVAEIVRQELTGDLGERITRNVRKLVRREIHRALLTREFE